MMKTLHIICIFVFTLDFFGQEQPLSIAQRQRQMSKLDWMVGSWEGSGWIDQGRQGKLEFLHTKTVRYKSNGLVLIIDGEGGPKIDGFAIYSDLRLLSFAPRDVAFKWHEFTPDGRDRMNEAHSQEKMLQVGFPPNPEESAMVGAGTFRPDIPVSNEGWVRFTISLNEKNEWIEIGEMQTGSEGKEKWLKFLEITLRSKVQ